MRSSCTKASCIGKQGLFSRAFMLAGAGAESGKSSWQISVEYGKELPTQNVLQDGAQLTHCLNALDAQRLICLLPGRLEACGWLQAASRTRGCGTLQQILALEVCHDTTWEATTRGREEISVKQEGVLSGMDCLRLEIYYFSAYLARAV